MDSVPHSISLTLYFSAIFHRMFLLIKSFLFWNWLWWHMPLILVEAGHLWVPGQPGYIPRPNLKNMQTNKKTQQNQTQKISGKVLCQGFREQWAAQRPRLRLQLTFTAWLLVLIGGFFRAACSAAVMFPVMTVKGITAKGSPALQDDFLNSNKSYCGHYVYYWKLHSFISNMSIRS